MPRGKAGGKEKSAVKKPRASKNGHQLAPPLKEGEILTDIQKHEWRVGKSIGSGGFGQLYLVSSDVNKAVGPNAEYVLKIEPHGNGPLFCELHFYQRAAKPDMVDEWISKHKVKKLGVPRFIAQGSHEYDGTKCRFMIMQRFGSDLQKLFEKSGKKFPRKTVILLALRLLDILEYIHSKGYVHADIKASNLLVGHAKGTTDQVFLVDYGLAYRYMTETGHKEYKEDPKKAHDGTIEFTSRDAHKGVSPSCRGDLEILGFCLLQWLCGKLPWEDKLQDKDYVKDQKIKYMADLPLFMKKCFPDGDHPDDVVEFLTSVNELEYDEEPEYDQLRKIFRDELNMLGLKDDGKFSFIVEANPSTSKEKANEPPNDVTPPKRQRAARQTTQKEPVKQRDSPKRKSKTRAILLLEQEDSEEEEFYSPQGHVRSPRRSPSPETTAPRGRKRGRPATPRTPSEDLRTVKIKKKTTKKSNSTTATQTTPGLKKNR